MRKTILTWAIAMISILAYSQDKIYTHKGDSILCTVTEMGEKTIKYKNKGEELTRSITKNLVSQVRFADGRIEKVSEKIIVNSELDWEKVIITEVKSDVEGLTRIGEVIAKDSSVHVTTNQSVMDKLKKEASAQGCHIVLLMTINRKGEHNATSGGTKVVVTGVAYKY